MLVALYPVCDTAMTATLRKVNRGLRQGAAQNNCTTADTHTDASGSVKLAANKTRSNQLTVKDASNKGGDERSTSIRTRSCLHTATALTGSHRHRHNMCWGLSGNSK